MVTITNGVLTAEIAERGAELLSVKKNGVEYLWNGDAAYWTGHAPVLFPICGGLTDDKYELNGKRYTLPKHGLARKRDFALESKTEAEVVFVLKSDDSTLEIYPFNFELRARYALIGETVSVDYIVTNKSDIDMPFTVGAHEGYVCPEGIEAYDVIFDQPESLKANVLHGNLLGYDTVDVLEGQTLKLDPKYFTVDALVFTAPRSRAVTLRNRATGRGVKVSFDMFPYLLIWQKCGAPYICLEPWCGLPDFTDASGIFTDKPGTLTAAPGETLLRNHTIRLL